MSKFITPPAAPATPQPKPAPQPAEEKTPADLWRDLIGAPPN